MIKCTKCNIDKQQNCFHRDRKSKTGFRTRCKKCVNTQNAEYSNNNKELIRKQNSLYYKKNKQALDDRVSTWIKDNPDKRRIIRRKSRKKNSANINERLAYRRAMKRKATPSWLTEEDRDKIKLMYKETKRLTLLTGISFHVDHIIPLKGELVSGLHVPNNLQILPYYENSSKRNKFDPNSFNS